MDAQRAIASECDDGGVGLKLSRQVGDRLQAAGRFSCPGEGLKLDTVRNQHIHAGSQGRWQGPGRCRVQHERSGCTVGGSLDSGKWYLKLAQHGGCGRELSCFDVLSCDVVVSAGGDGDLVLAGAIHADRSDAGRCVVLVQPPNVDAFVR